MYAVQLGWLSTLSGFSLLLQTESPAAFETMIMLRSPLWPYLPHYQILIKSNQLAGAGSVHIPRTTTAGAKVYKRRVFVLLNTKSISNTFNTIDGAFIRALTPFRWRLFGTGILNPVICDTCKKIEINTSKGWLDVPPPSLCQANNVTLAHLPVFVRPKA